MIIIDVSPLIVQTHHIVIGSHSSVGQSVRLLTVRSAVQARVGAFAEIEEYNSLAPLAMPLVSRQRLLYGDGSAIMSSVLGS
jgi:hypothetical protein